MTQKKPIIKDSQPLDLQHTVEIISGIPAWKFLVKVLLQHFLNRLTQKDDSG